MSGDVAAVKEVLPGYALDPAKSSAPDGYKQTEVGVIPESWNVYCVGEAFEICNSLRFPISAKIRKDLAGEYPYYGPTKIQDYLSEYRVEGEYALIGEDGDHFLDYEKKHQTQYVTGRFNVNNHAHLVKGKIGTAKWFFLYFRNRDISPYLSRQGAGRYKLNKASLASIPCAVPPAHEQDAIATALSDVDALLEELDRLIAKKRDLKQATMQQLLTGQTRLPGFEGEWQERRLIELANFYDNLRVPIAESKRDSGTTPYYGANGIQGYINGHTHDGEFVLIAEDGANDLNNYPVLYVKGKIWVNNHAHVIQGTPGEVQTRYLSYALKMVDFVQILVGGTRAKLNGSEAKSIKITVPSDTNEQAAIADTLSDMDAEIAALENRRAKTAAVKQAMMQELLTGRTRLI